MDKLSLSPATFLYPMPVVLAGALTGGKPNYATIAYCGIAQHSPPMISLASNKNHYTNSGIRENGTFSINIPSEDMVEVTDFIGLNSWRVVDKSLLFETFYGSLKSAPMIKECPLNLECRLVTTVDLKGINELFIGEIVGVYAEERYLTNGLPDITRIKPMVFSMHDNNYWKIGAHLAKAWSIGKAYRWKKPQD